MSARRRCRSGTAHSGAVTRSSASCSLRSFRGSSLATWSTAPRAGRFADGGHSATCGRPLHPRWPPEPLTVRALDWNDLLQADACTTCGRCNAACPATTAGKPLRPREVVLGIREALTDSRERCRWWRSARVASTPMRSGPARLAARATKLCPVGIDVYDKIVELRRARVEAGSIPDAAATFFESTANRVQSVRQAQQPTARVGAGPDSPRSPSLARKSTCCTGLAVRGASIRMGSRFRGR